MIRKNLVGVEDLNPHLGRELPHQLGGQLPLIKPHLHDWAWQIPREWNPQCLNSKHLGIFRTTRLCLPYPLTTLGLAKSSLKGCPLDSKLIGILANPNGRHKRISNKRLGPKSRLGASSTQRTHMFLQIYPNFKSSGSIGIPTSLDLFLSNYCPSGKSITGFPLSMMMQGIIIICLDAPKLYRKSFGRRSPGILLPGGGR